MRQRRQPSKIHSDGIMKMRTWLGCGLMAIGLTVLAAEDDGAKMIADKSDDGAAKMIAAFEAIKPPPAWDSSRSTDHDYSLAYKNEVKVYNDKRSELAKEFYRKFPDHPRALTYLYLMHWQPLASSGNADTALAEIDRMLADHPTASHRESLLYYRALTLISSRPRLGSTTAAVGSMTATAGDLTAAAKTATATAIDEFIKEFPKDKRGGICS